MLLLPIWVMLPMGARLHAPPDRLCQRWAPTAAYDRLLHALLRLAGRARLQLLLLLLLAMTDDVRTVTVVIVCYRW